MPDTPTSFFSEIGWKVLPVFYKLLLFLDTFLNIDVKTPDLIQEGCRDTELVLNYAIKCRQSTPKASLHFCVLFF